MRLNPDCVRDILLIVEQLATPTNRPLFPKEWPANQFEKYGPETILYHINYCQEAELLSVQKRYMGGEMLIKDLTPKGHEFLSNIRKDTNWNKTKELAEKIGSTSLQVLVSVASQVVSALIKSQFPT